MKKFDLIVGMSHASKRVSLVKSARGDIRFEGCDASGGWVAIKNNGAKAINLKGWILKKVINGMDKYSYTFTADNVAQPGKELRLVASGMKDEAKYSDIVVDNFTWAPTGKFFLVDDNNSEKATMDIKIDN